MVDITSIKSCKYNNHIYEHAIKSEGSSFSSFSLTLIWIGLSFGVIERVELRLSSNLFMHANETLIISRRRKRFYWKQESLIIYIIDVPMSTVKEIAPKSWFVAPMNADDMHCSTIATRRHHVASSCLLSCCRAVRRVASNDVIFWPKWTKKRGIRERKRHKPLRQSTANNR